MIVMNLRGWQVFRSKGPERASPLANVLPRVRSIREQAEWPSSAPPTIQEQRRDRIANARTNVVYRPHAHSVELGAEIASRPLRPLLLWIIVPLLVVSAGIIWVILYPSVPQPPQYISRSFRFQLPSVPPFLSEKLALTTAQEAVFKIVGYTELTAVANRAPAATAPDGSKDLYFVRRSASAGTILLESARLTNRWQITLQLRSNQLDCTVLQVR